MPCGVRMQARSACAAPPARSARHASRAALPASPGPAAPSWRRRVVPTRASGGDVEPPARRAAHGGHVQHCQPAARSAVTSRGPKAAAWLAGVAVSCQLLLAAPPAAAAFAPWLVASSSKDALVSAVGGRPAAQASTAGQAALEDDDGESQEQAPAASARGMLRYGEFEAFVTAGVARSVLLSPDGTMAGALLGDGRVVVTALSGSLADDLLRACTAHGVEVIVAASKQEFELNVPQAVPPALKVAQALAATVLPTLVVGTAVIFVLRLLRGGASGINPLSSFMSLRGGGVTGAAQSSVRFSDVAGVDGAKLELQEVVDFLKNPRKYSDLGARIPKGCLLVGPPGTGKTLLAKAVAGEAGVPFFSCAASEFVEIFVGVGASRVRDLFAKAKKAAPCIIFIDELDAVGRQRGAGIGGGSDEREQTINQLLAEMDGFEGNTGVIVLSATNRPDVLDSALLRPGRFDRRITVDLPDVQGRLAILRIYAAKMPLAPDVDLLRLARRTPGFSGADLKNLLNEAAIMTARRGKAQVTAEECADALDKIARGPEKAGALTTPAKKALVAYHEAGHAIVGALMPDFDRVERISIIPRASSGGATVFTPDEGRLSAGFYSRTFLLEQLSVALGGRAAEELVYGREAITTGAASDLRAVTRTARTMVEVAGLSRRFQHASVRAQGGPAFLGRSVATDTDMAGATADEVDAEIRAIVDEAYKRSLRVLRQNEAALHRIADRLIERESMDGAELEAILVEEGAHVCADVRVAAEADGAESEPQFRDGILLRLGRRGDDGDGAEVAR